MERRRGWLLCVYKCKGETEGERERWKEGGKEGGREREREEGKKRAHIIFWHVNPAEHWAIWAALTPSTRGRKTQWLQSYRAEYCHYKRVAFVLLAPTSAQSNRSLCPHNTVLGFKENLVCADWQHHLSFSSDNMYKYFQTPLWAVYIVPACSWNALSIHGEGCVAGSLGTPDEANIVQRHRRWVSLPCTCSGTETREPKSANLLSVHWESKLASFLRDLNLVFHLSGILYEMKGRFWLTVKPKLKGQACKVLSLALTWLMGKGHWLCRMKLFCMCYCGQLRPESAEVELRGELGNSVDE